MSFVHLHTHTEYSLLDGSNKIKSYVKKCLDMGMTAAAITDHGNLYGVTKFYDEWDFVDQDLWDRIDEEDDGILTFESYGRGRSVWGYS